MVHDHRQRKKLKRPTFQTAEATRNTGLPIRRNRQIFLHMLVLLTWWCFMIMSHLSVIRRICNFIDHRRGSASFLILLALQEYPVVTFKVPDKDIITHKPAWSFLETPEFAAFYWTEWDLGTQFAIITVVQFVCFLPLCFLSFLFFLLFLDFLDFLFHCKQKKKKRLITYQKVQFTFGLLIEEKEDKKRYWKTCWNRKILSF